LSLRIGVDVLDREELRALLGRPWFLRFAYAPEETALADAMGAERRLEFLAGRFAAKEAVLKVLGTGMLQGVAPYEICVDRDTDGAPVVRFRGRAARWRPPEISLSITHKQNVVAAVAIALPGAACGCDDSPTESAIDRKEFAIMSSAADSDEDHHHSTERHSELAQVLLALRRDAGRWIHRRRLVQGHEANSPGPEVRIAVQRPVSHEVPLRQADAQARTGGHTAL
jgi:phosphopantetheine--protein transferase-like protein